MPSTQETTYTSLHFFFNSHASYLVMKDIRVTCENHIETEQDPMVLAPPMSSACLLSVEKL